MFLKHSPPSNRSYPLHNERMFTLPGYVVGQSCISRISVAWTYFRCIYLLWVIQHYLKFRHIRIHFVDTVQFPGKYFRTSSRNLFFYPSNGEWVYFLYIGICGRFFFFFLIFVCLFCFEGFFGLFLHFYITSVNNSFVLIKLAMQTSKSTHNEMQILWCLFRTVWYGVSLLETHMVFLYNSYGSSLLFQLSLINVCTISRPSIFLGMSPQRIDWEMHKWLGKGTSG